MKFFRVYNLRIIFMGAEMPKDKMSRACSTLRNAYKVFVRKSQVKGSLGRPRRVLEDDVILKE
jgi:hypothetical protein